MTFSQYIVKCNPNLADSKEVMNEQNRSDSKVKRIEDYFKRIEELYGENTSLSKEELKNKCHELFVIDIYNIPFGVNADQVIRAQKDSIDKWVDYLTDENSKYPFWTKYLVFMGISKIGTYIEENDVYAKRTNKTIAPFIEPNPEVIAYCIGCVINYIDGDKSLDENCIKLIENGNFAKLYTMLYTKSKKNLSGDTSGIWVKYSYETLEEARKKAEEGIEPEYVKLYKSLQGKSTGWCTAASLDFARNQICGGNGYRGGDFYVYYTAGEDGEYSQPRVAIRMDGLSKVGEIRGVESNQNIEDDFENVIEKKLYDIEHLSKDSIDKNMQIISDSRMLSLLTRKTKQGIPLTKEEERFIYEIDKAIKYFGWTIDDRVDKIREANPVQYRENAVDLIDKSYNFTPKNISMELKKDRSLMFEFVKKNLLSLSYMLDEFKADKELVLEAAKWHDTALTFASSELAHDRDFILALAKQIDSSMWLFAGVEFRSDKEIMRESVRRGGPLSLKYATSELTSDKEYMLELVRMNGNAIEYASFDLKDDKDVALAAVQNNEFAIRCVSERLKNDMDVALASISDNGVNIKYVSPTLRMDKNFVLKAVSITGEALSYVPIVFQRDKDVVLAAVKNNGLAIQYASRDLMADKDVVLAALRNNAAAIKYISKNLINDRDCILEMISSGFVPIDSLPIQLRCDREFMLIAIKTNAYALKYALENLINDRDFILEAVRSNGLALKYAPYKFCKDREVVLEAIKNNGEAIGAANEELLDDRELVLEALRSNGRALRLLGDDYRDDEEIVLEAIKSKAYSLDYASKRLKYDKEFIKKCILLNYECCDVLYDELRKWLYDKDIVLLIIRQCIKNDAATTKELFNIIPHGLMDIDFSLSLVNLDIRFYKYIPDEIKNDPEFLNKLTERLGGIIDSLGEPNTQTTTKNI